jgi:hypothetical protein
LVWQSPCQEIFQLTTIAQLNTELGKTGEQTMFQIATCYEGLIKDAIFATYNEADDYLEHIISDYFEGEWERLHENEQTLAAQQNRSPRIITDGEAWTSVREWVVYICDTRDFHQHWPA